jgi:chromate reductase, NAD(P)H dehydrogenase (quinone)
LSCASESFLNFLKGFLMAIKILAICGSARRDSLNQKVLDVAVRGAVEAGAEVTAVCLTDLALPIYDGDLEAESGLPTGAGELQALLAQHDALLIATPEYNGGYTALLKNAIDWLSRPREDGSSGVALFAGKAAALVSASPGQLGGLRSQTGMRTVLEKLGAHVIPQSFALSSAHEAFDGEGKMKDANAERLVAGVGGALSRTAAKLAWAIPA